MDTKTVHVPHLGGIDASYAMPFPYDSSKPTCVLVNAMTTTADLYEPQFKDKKLTDAMNLLAIEPLGHGGTRCKTEHFTYWDTAIMNLLVLDALGIEKAFALGTSQGGWLVVRMALLAPDRIEGIIPLGTSMDYESERSRQLGCWDATANLAPRIEEWSKPASSDWTPSDEWCTAVGALGFGDGISEESLKFWFGKVKETYRGDEGRKRIRMCAINLLERDGIRSRCQDVKCPVMWLHGTKDIPFNIELPKDEIKLFTASVDAKLDIIDGGAHYLSASNPKEVDEKLIAFIKKYHKGGSKL